MKKESVFSSLIKSVGFVVLFYALMYASLVLTVLLAALANMAAGREITEGLLWQAALALNYESMLLFTLLFVGIVFLTFRKSTIFGK